MIKAKFHGEKIASVSPSAFALYEKSRFGEKKGKRIEYSGVEALFLLEKNKLQLFSANKLISEDNLLKKLKRKDKKIETKFTVFSDLRKKGYIVKTALKFGAEFRVYQKGIRPGQDHAKWILLTVKESDNLKWHEFTAKSRVAHSTRKNLLIGIVDEEDSVSYYEISWTRT